MMLYNHHLLKLNYIYGTFTNPNMQFLTHLVKHKSIYSCHKIVLEKYGFFTLTWTSRLQYSTCYICYWSKLPKIHSFNKPEKPPSQSSVFVHLFAFF